MYSSSPLWSYTKTLGAALRRYKNKKRMQTTYEYAIRKNKGDPEASCKAIWAIYHHMIIGPQYESVERQHSYCPSDDNTWCKYHKDKLNNINFYDR